MIFKKFTKVKKPKKKEREPTLPLTLFFPTKWLYRLGIPIILSVQQNRYKSQVIVSLLSFLYSRNTLALIPYHHFWLSSPISRFMYSSTLSSVILVPPKAAKNRSIRTLMKKNKPIHSHVVITTSPLTLYVLPFLKKRL